MSYDQTRDICLGSCASIVREQTKSFQSKRAMVLPLKNPAREQIRFGVWGQVWDHLRAQLRNNKVPR